jgi:hypothetical protein
LDGFSVCYGVYLGRWSVPNKRIQITLDDEVYAKLRKSCSNGGYVDFNEYVQEILRDYIDTYSVKEPEVKSRPEVDMPDFFSHLFKKGKV